VIRVGGGSASAAAIDAQGVRARLRATLAVPAPLPATFGVFLLVISVLVFILPLTTAVEDFPVLPVAFVTSLAEALALGCFCTAFFTAARFCFVFVCLEVVCRRVLEDFAVFLEGTAGDLMQGIFGVSITLDDVGEQQ